jgi:hypothetical protein
MYAAFEDCVLIPAVYIGRGLAYKVHRGCFGHLRAVAEGLLKQGLAKGEAFKRLLENPMPPSVAWEALIGRPPKDGLLDWLTKLLGRPR